MPYPYYRDVQEMFEDSACPPYDYVEAEQEFDDLDRLIAELKAIREAPLSDFAEPEEEEIPEVDMDAM